MGLCSRFFFLSFFLFFFDFAFVFAYGCLIVPASFVEKIILPLFNSSYNVVKDLWSIFAWGYFWVLYHVPLIYVSILPSTLDHLDYFICIYSIYIYIVYMCRCVYIHILSSQYQVERFLTLYSSLPTLF